jgi:hypothetical protein
MTKILSLGVVALAFAITSCSDNNNQTVSKGVRPDAVKLVPHPGTPLFELEEQSRIEKKNRAISKSQEIVTGKEDFQKLVDYIWKNGSTITDGKSEILCGKEYVFSDRNGNTHIYSAFKTDTVTNEASMTGKVQNIFASAYRKGIKDSEHFFFYVINDTSVYCPLLELDGTWKHVEEVALGYGGFLRKVSK